MEFFLAKDIPMTMTNAQGPDSADLCTPHSIYVKLEPCGDNMEGHVRDICKSRLCSVLGFDQGELTGSRMSSKRFQLCLCIKAPDGVSRGRAKEGLMELCYFTYYKHSFFHRVSSAFTPNVKGPSACNASIRIKIRFPGPPPQWLIESSDIPIKATKNKEVGSTMYGNIHSMGTVPGNILSAWTRGNKILTGIFTVILVLNDAGVHQLLARNTCISPSSVALREMLENDEETDTEVVAAGVGSTPIKCHRAFLATRSPVFRAMFRSGMKEATTNRIQIDDMTELEVRAFIKFLYTWDLKAPLEDCRTAFEMLKAGNCYQVADLCTAMFELIMLKPVEWLSADVAVDLLLFSRNLCSCTTVSIETHWKDLKLKSAQVLKWYSTQKPLDLMNSEKYKNLHEQHPRVAMELHASFIRHANMSSWQEDSA